jgi:hypothetical protein
MAVDGNVARLRSFVHLHDRDAVAIPALGMLNFGTDVLMTGAEFINTISSPHSSPFDCHMSDSVCYISMMSFC